MKGFLHGRRFTVLTALCAGIFALSFAGCNTDSFPDYEDSGGGDRTTRLYKVIVPAPTETGGVSASPSQAKLGTTVIVSYVPPQTMGEEETVVENVQTNDYTNYTIKSLTGTYNDGQKTIKFTRGGGGNLGSPCPMRTYIYRPNTASLPRQATRICLQ
jgi:hypothetical protein